MQMKMPGFVVELNVLQQRGVIGGTGVLLALAYVVVGFFRDRIPFPGGLLAILLGAATGLWFGVYLVNKLSRDWHITMIAGVSGISLDGLASQIASDPGQAITNVGKTLLNLAGVLGPIVLNAIHSSEMANPSMQLVNAGVIAALLLFLGVLVGTLPNNPPSVEKLIALRNNLTPAERTSLRDAFPPQSAAEVRVAIDKLPDREQALFFRPPTGAPSVPPKTT
jgi:hypothetical protein